MHKIKSLREAGLRVEHVAFSFMKRRVHPLIYLSILSSAQPGPIPARARPAHELYWAGVGRDLEAREIFFGPSPARNAVFSCFTL
jgi:hypothetical protein